MSTSYYIYRFAKPSKKELSLIDYYSDYDLFPVYDVENKETKESVKLFRNTDKAVENIKNSRFAQNMELPEKVMDYEKLFCEIGFSKQAIDDKRVHIKYCNGYHWEYTDGENIKRVSNRALQNYEKVVQTKCIALKMECLWNSNDVHYYPDKTRIYKHFPALRTYQFVPICNSILAKAEIPFLIFERNKGRCFLEMC